MEFLGFFFLLGLISWLHELITANKNSVTTKQIVPNPSNANIDALDSILKSMNEDISKKSDDIFEKKSHPNNTYNVNVTNVYVQNNYYNNKSTEEQKSHGRDVWKRLGYKVKAGETYSYKMYGREIFEPHQVVKISSSSYQNNYLPSKVESGLSENQKKVKTLGYSLVNKYGSKKVAKDILVENYGLDENTAKYAAGYIGYKNW